MTAISRSMTTRGLFRIVVALTLTLSIVGCATAPASYSSHGVDNMKAFRPPGLAGGGG